VRKYSSIILISLGLTLVFQSCSYRKKNILFKTPKPLKGTDAVTIFGADGTSKDTVYRHRIKVGDRILIRFLNNYDLGQASGQSATSAANSQLAGGSGEGYLVNYDSTVTLPLIGQINIVGLTRLEAARKLEGLYSKHVNNPIIDINISSLSVSVFGEVNSPGKISIDKENTTIIDIIAKAGGLKESSKKNRIQIIRPNEIIIVNMKDIGSTFNPKTVIHDNDIIYVQPYGFKANLEPVASSSQALAPVLTVLQITLLSTQLYLIFNATR
jgi:polysaccharide export outer membrane protein